MLHLKVQVESMERLGVKTHSSDTEPMTAVLFRQARMQVRWHVYVCVYVGALAVSMCFCACMRTCGIVRYG